MTHRVRIHVVTIVCLLALAAVLAACEVPFTPIPPPDAASAGIDNTQSNEGVSSQLPPLPDADMGDPEQLTIELAELCTAIPDQTQGLLLESTVDYVDPDRFQVVGPTAVLTNPDIVEITNGIVGEFFAPLPDQPLVLGNIVVLEASEGNVIVAPAQDGIEMATWVITLSPQELDEATKERKLTLQFNAIAELNTVYNAMVEEFGFEFRPCATLVPNLGHLEGQPHSGRGGPFGLGAHEVDRLSFDEQWGFKPATGIDWVDMSIPAAQTVNVGVFDSSPLNPGHKSEEVFVSLPIAGNSEMLEFTAFHRNLGKVSHTGVITAPDHGLAALMLVHQIAPDSNLYLYQIMNYDMVASLLRVLLAVRHFQSLHPPADGPSVINLSLGVPRELIDSAIVNDGLLPLWITLAYYRLNGGVIVASAGNDFDSTLTNSVQPPALWRFSVGVSASTNSGHVACYSQHSDSVLFAPGGDGAPAASGICPSEIDECTLDNMGNCEYGIVSMTIDHPGDGSEIPPMDAYPLITGTATSPQYDYPNWPTTYYYWAGTSFAAPMVTGLVARILEAGVPREELKYVLWGCANRSTTIPIIDVKTTLTAIQAAGPGATATQILAECPLP